MSNIQPFFVQITNNNKVLDSIFGYKVGFFRPYKKVKLQLGFAFDTFDDAYAKVEWSSDNKKVVIDKDGLITNLGMGYRAANITVKLTDNNGNVFTDTVRVIFYKFSYQLKKLSK